MSTFIVGQDISEFQGKIDWDTFKNNANFVIIRATLGTARVDNQFFFNRDGARRVGLPLGFYHYAYPQYNTPEAEADFLCSQLSDLKPGELIILDFEENWNGDWVDFCKRWLDRVVNHFNGYKPLIYLNQSQLQAKNWQSLVDAGYGLWVAAYTYDPTKNNFVTGSWKFAAMQQWTNQQQVPGISGQVDGDVFFGDVATFKKYGYNPPQPQPDQQKIIDQLKAEMNARQTTIDALNQKVQKYEALLETIAQGIEQARTY